MSKDQLSQRLFAVFLSELAEHRETLERELLALEQAKGTDERRALIDSSFRAAHSLKGAARSVKAGGVERVCHRLETQLHELKSGSRVLSRELLTTLLADVDALASEAQKVQVATPVAAAAAQNAVNAPRGVIANADKGARPSAARDGASEQFFRIATDKVDALVARAAELTTFTSMLNSGLDGLAEVREQLSALTRAQSREPVSAQLRTQLHDVGKALDQAEERLRKQAFAVTRSSERLDDDAQRLRMIPFAEACSGLERAVRDVAQTLDKPAELTIEHNDVELDRAVAQRLRDPLLHLLRNALSHGIETRATRFANGKREVAQIVVSAAVRGKLVEISVRDDGAGFDLSRLRARAERMQLDSDVPEDALLRYAFLPGFSTADSITEIAGRGVGLDAVQRAIEDLHGSVSVSSVAGKGSTFSLKVPLTLSKLRCVFAVAGGRSYAIPATHVERVIRFLPDQVLTVEGREMLRAGDALVQLSTLSTLLGLTPLPPRDDSARTALLIEAEGRKVALLVEELGREREVTARALPKRVSGARQVSSAAFLELGQIALVLQPQDLCRRARELPLSRTGLLNAQIKAKQRVLVADDSPTTRAVLKSVLDQAGYDVTLAQDGEQALRMLGAEHFDALVSDVQMPNKDGFALTESVRKDAKLVDLPVVLMTSLENESDRMRGLAAGASAYLTKGAFDHRTLLETLSSLL